MTGIACDNHNGIFVAYDSAKYVVCPLCRMIELFNTEFERSSGYLKLASLQVQNSLLRLENAPQEKLENNRKELDAVHVEIGMNTKKFRRLISNFVVGLGVRSPEVS